jgi:hypothetical protein
MPSFNTDLYIKAGVFGRGAEDKMDDNIDKFLAEKKVEDALSPAQPTEYYVEGSAVEMGNGPVPCRLDKRDHDKATITLADGPNTGAQYTVSTRHIFEVNSQKLEDIGKGLF